MFAVSHGKPVCVLAYSQNTRSHTLTYFFHHHDGGVVIHLWIESPCYKCSGALLHFDHPHSILLLTYFRSGVLQQRLMDCSRVLNGLRASKEQYIQ